MISWELLWVGLLIISIIFLGISLYDKDSDAIIQNILFFIIMVACVMGWVSDIPANWQNENIHIVSLERWVETSWNFVLWFWSVDGIKKYYAYKMISSNQYYLVTLPNVVITETNQVKPAYVKTSKCSRKFIFTRCKPARETIYVPVWTIKKRFSL